MTPSNLSQYGLKPIPLMTSPTKKQNLKLPNFFNADKKTRYIFWGFQQLNSYLTQSAGEIWSARVDRN